MQNSQHPFDELMEKVLARRAQTAEVSQGLRQLAELYSEEFVKQGRIRSPKKAISLASTLSLLGYDCSSLSYIWNPGKREPLPLTLYAHLVVSKEIIGEHLDSLPDVVGGFLGHLATSAQKVFAEEDSIQVDVDLLTNFTVEAWFASELCLCPERFQRLWNERKLSKAKKFEQQFAVAVN
ncbi:hypothetical protein HYR54_15850 [Candidatus Acetothermia bacterium]|nr:hypothetical protein [Candidatus Acetothermia bacterium]